MGTSKRSYPNEDILHCSSPLTVIDEDKVGLESLPPDDVLHCYSPLSSLDELELECEEDADESSILSSQQKLKKMADGTCSSCRLYGLPDAAASGEDLIEELASLDISANENDVPVIIYDEETPPCSLYGHVALGHEKLNPDGSRTVYLNCPGCCEDTFRSQTQDNPDGIFQKIPCRQVIPVQAGEAPHSGGQALMVSNSALATTSQGSQGDSLAQNQDNSNDTVAQNQDGSVDPNSGRRRWKGHRSGASRAGRDKRKAEFGVKKEFEQVFGELIEESKVRNGPGFAIQIERPPKHPTLPPEFNGGPISEPSSSQKRNERRGEVAKAKKRNRFMLIALPDSLNKKRGRSFFGAAEHAHGEFVRRPRSQKVVQGYAKDVGTDTITDYPEGGHLFVKSTSKFFMGPEDPEYLLQRWDGLISEKLIAYIWDLWLKLKKKYPMKKSCSHCSKNKSMHVGFWSHYWRQPYLTSDSKPKDEEACIALDNFLAAIGEHVMPTLLHMLKLHDPQVYHKMQIAHDYVKSFPDNLKILECRPALDFGGLCQTISIKEGGSQIAHLDWMDHPLIYAFVICIGPGWTGGKLFFPQLRKAVPTQPGQVIVFQA
ncbi:hypothetical protein M422DRAFT_255111 [Sphaerobolus stellatus SS14]|uniref:Uncharacterized protein n=1 Tax=Sphaerobolus stellatus (strain SS14) TaxID=990650 RepID=A0A0C9VJK8_SPHS4|nr:hypothetical protein M422DRAFT_255111 [Sphaerobolus stellatus SS14]